VRPVGVVGASGRAAAVSLLRAGYEPWAVDLFADRDLRRIAPTVRCPPARYPAALPGLTDGMPPGPVLYTGGLENHPGVVRELAARRELWGNPPDVLEHVRDPFRLSPVYSRPAPPHPAAGSASQSGRPAATASASPRPTTGPTRRTTCRSTSTAGRCRRCSSAATCSG
jgi:hypothetical protein